LGGIQRRQPAGVARLAPGRQPEHHVLLGTDAQPSPQVAPGDALVGGTAGDDVEARRAEDRDALERESEGGGEAALGELARGRDEIHL
jgi:hypothetical protein